MQHKLVFSARTELKDLKDTLLVNIFHINKENLTEFKKELVILIDRYKER